MTSGLHLIAAAVAAEHDKRPDLRHAAHGRPRRPGPIRTRLGGALVSLGERIGGPTPTPIVPRNPCA